MKLPVEEIRDELVSPFPEGQPKRVLLKAPTGSGKSTMIPLMLEQEGRDGLIVVIQPRRIAARMLANRVAHLYGCKVGEEVGYSVRFDQRKSKKTKILFVTDGIFQNWCDQDPTLEEVGTVIFDEFHERRVASDVTLGKCLNLQELERDDLKVVVMSATLEIANLSEFLGECRELEANGRAYPVDIQYKAEQITQRGGGNQRREGIWDRCVQVAKGEIQSPDVGHILIFLPGVFEIKKTVNLLENGGVFKGWKICPLYSALSPQLQDEAVAPSNQPKINHKKAKINPKTN